MWETRVQSLGRKIPWRRKWQPTLVFLPGEFQGRRSLVGYSPWGCRESDRTEQLMLSHCCLWSLCCELDLQNSQSFILYNWDFVPFDQPVLIPPPSPQPLEITILTVSFYAFDYFRLYTQVGSYNTCLSVYGLFHWAQCLPGSYMFLQVGIFSSFLRLNSISLYSYNIC